MTDYTNDSDCDGNLCTKCELSYKHTRVEQTDRQTDRQSAMHGVTLYKEGRIIGDWLKSESVRSDVFKSTERRTIQ